MKTMNLYFDFEFTSLSPDAQPVSLGIVSDAMDVRDYPTITRPYKPGKKIEFIDQSKSFYAEFSDFDINRCDDWVKENVVGKLKFFGKEKTKKLNKAWPTPDWMDSDNSWVSENVAESVSIIATTNRIKKELKEWLSQFSDYQIQFIGDCATWDWWFMVQLLAEWEEGKIHPYLEQHNLMKKYFDENEISFKDYNKEQDRLEKLDKWCPALFNIFHIKGTGKTLETYAINVGRTGLPKLPANISPVPFDLNDLIAIKEGITPKEAFDLGRYELCGFNSYTEEIYYQENIHWPNDKHNSLFDAKVIKEICNKLNAGTS